MPRIHPIDPATAAGRTRELLDGVNKSLGMTPNMMKTMAQSPAVLEGYLALNQALSHGKLDPRLRERLAIVVAQANGCDYCLSAHSTLAKATGLPAEEISAARKGSASEKKAEAALKFAQELVHQRGEVSDGSLARIRSVGYADAEIAEVIAHVAINIFTNYFNIAAQTEVDFPKVVAAEAA